MNNETTTPSFVRLCKSVMLARTDNITLVSPSSDKAMMRDIMDEPPSFDGREKPSLEVIINLIAAETTDIPHLRL